MEKFKPIKLDVSKLAQEKEGQEEYKRLKPYWDLQGQLIEARRRAKMSQKDVAKKMNIKPSVISKLESIEKANCTFATIVEYARAIGLKEIKISLDV